MQSGESSNPRIADRSIHTSAAARPPQTSSEVLELFKKENIRFVDLQFTDLSGRLQHTTVPAHSFSEKSFENGVPKLDGSSIRGFTEIQESDMLLMPDVSTFAMVPWMPDSMKTARLICNVEWGAGLGPLSRDPRWIAKKAEETARKQGYDTVFVGSELEFFVFDRVTWDVATPFKGQSYSIESKEAAWSTTGVNYPIRFKGGYFPAPPIDTLTEYRNECVTIMEDQFGMITEAHHHEVATAGQVEIDVRYDRLAATADNMMTFKYIARNVASKYGLMPTMMPKPLVMDNGSGMHAHFSLWDGGKNLFYDPDDSYAELSQLCRYFTGGVMEHARSLAAIYAPTTNSYRRLVPGYEAPVYVAWSLRNRSATVRIPGYEKGPQNAASKRIEFRPPDPACNPYLAFAGILAAGLDGIKKKISPGDPVDENIYHIIPQRRKQLGIRELPGSLEEALECLKSDQEYLKTIFSQDVIETIIEIETEDYKAVAIRPHPYEFYLYFDA
jgi:glutamine synthetase